MDKTQKEALKFFCLERGGAEKGIFPFVADVSNEDNLNKIADRIQAEIGRPTVWINNAGIAKLGALEKTSSADFAQVMAVNFFGVVYGTRTAMRLMSEPAFGTIVNIASVAGLVSPPFMTSYAASKSAVIGFTRSLRLEQKAAHSPLKFKLVMPGFVKTAIMNPQNGIEFPKWFDWAIADVDRTSKEIWNGIQNSTEEIIPTWNGKLASVMSRFTPSISQKMGHALTSKNWKELLGLKPIVR